MKMLKTTASAIALSTLISTTTMASDNLNGLRIAVIKDALGSDEILNGHYSSAMTRLAEANTTGDFEHSMGLCVANIKLEEWKLATQACTKSIEVLQPMLATNGRAKYLMSVTYSNRAVARYLANDTHGALDDLSTAILIDDNKLVKNNLLQLKYSMASIPTENIETLGSAE